MVGGSLTLAGFSNLRQRLERNDAAMSSKKQVMLAYGLAIVLLVVGAGSYAYTALTTEVLDEPVRIQFQSVAGKVLFSHKMHTADSGYGFACFDCHHHPEGDDTALKACGAGEVSTVMGLVAWTPQ